VEVNTYVISRSSHAQNATTEHSLERPAEAPGSNEVIEERLETMTRLGHMSLKLIAPSLAGDPSFERWLRGRLGWPHHRMCLVAYG
jgi:hypothetical protein